MPAAETQIALTPLDLQSLIAAAVAAAVAEAKKPYLDPKKVAQDAADRQRMHEQEEQTRANREAAIADCTHQREDGSYNLNGQYNCLHQMALICGNCGGTFTPGHPQYKDLVKRVKINQLGNARN